MEPGQASVVMMKIFGISGFSGSGKTTLIEAILPILADMCVTTSVIKHTHHDFDVEPPGKDSARFRSAGAYEVMTCSAYRYAIVRELRGVTMPDLTRQLQRLAPCDLVLVEGFHADPIDRIEVFRPSLGRSPRCQGDPHLVALATDAPYESNVPLWPLNQPERIAQLICAHLQIKTKGGDGDE